MLKHRQPPRHPGPFMPSLLLQTFLLNPMRAPSRESGFVLWHFSEVIEATVDVRSQG